MEKDYEFNKNPYIITVDYKQANDSVNRQELWETMMSFGIPQKNISLVKMCKNKTLLKLLFLQVLSPAFGFKSELQQEYILSPTVFNLGLEKFIRESF